MENLKTAVLKKPVCATHGRYNWGPKDLLIAGTGTAKNFIWKYSYTSKKLTKLTLKKGFTDSRYTGAGNNYIISWEKNKRKYNFFDLKKMTWSDTDGNIIINSKTGIVAVHVFMNLCPPV